MKKLEKLEILYEDKDLLMVNKPAGLYSIPDRYQTEKDNLLWWLWARDENIIPVHRLDRDTSGVICYARHPEAHHLLNTQFEERQVKKVYWALLSGSPVPAEGEINKPISDTPGTPGKMRIHADGKPSLTYYQLMVKYQQFSLVEMKPQTGRTHQIRIHSQSIGHPLAIDPVYGTRDKILLSDFKKKYKHALDEERPLMNRLSLHASSLMLIHPFSGQPLKVSAPLPKDFSVLLHQLNKWG